MDGILLINKPMDMTSHDAVALVRRGLKTQKVGHTGTLDPNATGLLPICVGKATKIAGIISEGTKTYKTTLKLGLGTDTQDCWGKITDVGEYQHLTDEQIKTAVLSMVGKSNQLTPMYSARKVDGQKLLNIARDGKTTEKFVPIEVFSIEILSIEKPMVELRLIVSKGTYIRTICHDIGIKLGTFAHMTELVREKHSGFTLKNTISPFEVTPEILGTDAFIPLDKVFRLDEKFGIIEIDGLVEKSKKLFFDGVKLDIKKCVKAKIVSDGEVFAVYFDSQLFGLASKTEDGIYINSRFT